MIRYAGTFALAAALLTSVACDKPGVAEQQKEQKAAQDNADQQNRAARESASAQADMSQKVASAQADYLNGAVIPLDGGAGLVDAATLAFAPESP